MRTAESISNKIQKLRDEELHPQLIELLKGYAICPMLVELENSIAALTVGFCSHVFSIVQPQENMEGDARIT